MKTRERRRRHHEQISCADREHEHEQHLHEDEEVGSSASESGRSVSMSVSTTSMSQLKSLHHLTEATPASLVSPDLMDSRNFGFVNHVHELQSQHGITKKKEGEEGMEKTVACTVVFDEEKMQSFDDLYAFIVAVDAQKNEVEMERDLKGKVQAFVDGGKIELKSFEKAILMQKILEL